MDSESPNLIHCSYHKCMTVYYAKVMRTVFSERIRPWKKGYRHYNSKLHEFMEDVQWREAASINNHMLNLDELRPYKITRCVRDPRDMIVSGYHYHKRAAEPWCSIPNPSESDWELVNGTIPDGILEGESYSDMLKRLDIEEGMLAEMQFRSKHYHSMMEWPLDDPDILLFRYEEILGNEESIFDAIFDHYNLSRFEKWIGRNTAIRNSASRMKGKSEHIRNPSSGQWRQQFSALTQNRFEEMYPGLVERLGYD